MVADRPTSVLFTVDAENESTLADDDEVSVTVTQTHADGSTTETTGTMLGETIQRITRSDQPSMTAPVERTFQDAPPDRRPPVFELAGDTESISVSLSAADESGPLRIDGTSAPIEAGTDFDIAEMEPLTIGFIAIQAPETTLKEKFEAMGFSLEDIDEDDRDERLLRTGIRTARSASTTNPIRERRSNRSSRSPLTTSGEPTRSHQSSTRYIPTPSKGRPRADFCRISEHRTDSRRIFGPRTTRSVQSFRKRRSTKSSQLSPPTITSTTTGQRAGSTSDRPGHTRRRNFPSHKPRVRSRRARLGNTWRRSPHRKSAIIFTDRSHIRTSCRCEREATRVPRSR